MLLHTSTFRGRTRVERVSEHGPAVMAHTMTSRRYEPQRGSLIGLMRMPMIMVMPGPGRAAHEETT